MGKLLWPFRAAEGYQQAAGSQLWPVESNGRMERGEIEEKKKKNINPIALLLVTYRP